MLSLSMFQGGVSPATGKKLFSGTLFHDMLCIHNRNAVGIPDRGEAVGDHDDGFSLTETVNALLDPLFGDAVQCGSRFIENQKKNAYSGFGSGLAGGGLFPVIVPAAGPVVLLLGLAAVRGLCGRRGLDGELLNLHRGGLSALRSTAGRLRGGMLLAGVGVMTAAFRRL